MRRIESFHSAVLYLVINVLGRSLTDILDFCLSHILARLFEIQNYSQIIFLCMFETALELILCEDKGCFRVITCLNDPGLYQVVSEKIALL